MMVPVRTTRTVVLIWLSALLLAGTAAGCTRHPTRRPQPAPAPAATVAAGQIRTVRCTGTEAHVEGRRSGSPDDLTVGPLTWPGLKAWAGGDPAHYGDPASGDYKVGVTVLAGRTATVTVPATARGQLGLNYGQAYHYTPAAEVTFVACPAADTTYVGGFHLTGRGCVPLDVQVGESAPTRVTVSFFAGRC
jgi:hypothetical protein